MEKNKVYYFRVMGVNYAGEGDLSDPVYVPYHLENPPCGKVVKEDPVFSVGCDTYTPVKACKPFNLSISMYKNYVDLMSSSEDDSFRMNDFK